MPLAVASDRELIHTRTITCEGYAREDGLFDVDGWLTDAKTYNFTSTDRGEVKAGVPVHGMGLRMTIDRDLNIREIAASMDYTPFNMCPSITPNFQRLVGLNLSKGFNKAVREALGGTQGCVHLVDLLRPMANTAYQLLSPTAYQALKDQEARGETVNAFFINQCHSWKSDSEVTLSQFPSLHTGSN